MTVAPTPPERPSTLPATRDARPGGRRASRSPRGPVVASLTLHALLLVLGTAAVRPARRAGPPEAAGTVALDVPAADATPLDDAPEPLDDVEVVPPEPPALPPVPDATPPAPDEPAPPDDEPAPPPEEEVAPPPPAPTAAAPADPTRRTRRDPPPAAAPPAPSTPVVAAAAPARGARPPLVAVASPAPPLVEGGAPGATLVVVLEYTIGPDGVVTDAVVRASSGSEVLDASTRAFVLAHWRYAPPGEPRRVVRRFVFTYAE